MWTPSLYPKVNALNPKLPLTQLLFLHMCS